MAFEIGTYHATVSSLKSANVQKTIREITFQKGFFFMYQIVQFDETMHALPQKLKSMIFNYYFS